jgi:hypothetical protein
MRLRTLFAQLIFITGLAVTAFPAQGTQSVQQNKMQLPQRNSFIAPQPSDSADSMQMLQRRQLDKGIYLPTYADGKSMCAAIMSYNFTPGENPRLKNVTTCTPARPNSVYRTDHENRKRPRIPSLLMISSPQSSSVK